MVVRRQRVNEVVSSHRVANSVNRNDQILYCLNSAAVGTACSLLGSTRNDQAALKLFQKHLFVGNTFVTLGNDDVLEKIGKVMCACFLAPY